jgi:hypothetical protein
MQKTNIHCNNELHDHTVKKKKELHDHVGFFNPTAKNSGTLVRDLNRTFTLEAIFF